MLDNHSNGLTPVNVNNRNKLSTLTKEGESTDVSFTRAVPNSLGRKESLSNNRVDSHRPSSLNRGGESILPAQISMNQNMLPATNDSDLALYDVYASKRSQIRANLYNQTPTQSIESSNKLSPIKAKRFS